jgi:hypothetical protein
LFQIESDNLQKLRKEKVAVDEALAARHEPIFVGMQIGWLVGQEEFWRHRGAGWVHQATNYFF